MSIAIALTVLTPTVWMSGIEGFPSAAIAQSLQDRQAEARRLYNQGIQFYQAEQLTEALDAFTQSLNIYRELGLEESEETLLYNIALIYESLGESEEALQYYLQSLELITEEDDPQEAGATLNAIGVLYGNLGQYEQAVDYYEQALVIRQQTGDRTGESVTLTNLGAVYVALGRYGEAIDLYEQALAIQSDINDATYLEMLQGALTISQQMGDRQQESLTLNNLGQVYAELGQSDQVLTHYQQALAIAPARAPPSTTWAMCMPIWASTTRRRIITSKPCSFVQIWAIVEDRVLPSAI